MGIIYGDDYGPASAAYSRKVQGGAPGDQEGEHGLEIFVVFTDGPGTCMALQTAGELAQELRGHIRLFVPYEVPYTLPLTQPAVAVEFLEGKIRNMAYRARLDVAAHICLCRDKAGALKSLVGPGSLVVVGGKKRWWPTAAQKLARQLERDGRHVIFAELR